MAPEMWQALSVLIPVYFQDSVPIQEQFRSDNRKDGF